jgi:hypothetical protein
MPRSPVALRATSQPARTHLNPYGATFIWGACHALAETQTQLHQRLLELTPTDSAALEAAWQAASEACLKADNDGAPAGFHDIPAQFLVLITCRDEKHQVELLSRFSGEGLECKALLS